MRLTKRYDNGVVMAEAAWLRDVLVKLAAYEDAEEQGRLVVLPCKVGDVVYYIDDGKSYKAKASTIRVNKYGIRVYCERNFMGLIGFEGIYGKTVFLAREEAEAALKEISEAAMPKEGKNLSEQHKPA